MQYAHLRPPSALPSGTSLYLLRDAPDLTPTSAAFKASDRWVLKSRCANGAGGDGGDGGDGSCRSVDGNGIGGAASADGEEGLDELWRRAMCMAVGEIAGTQGARFTTATAATAAAAAVRPSVRPSVRPCAASAQRHVPCATPHASCRMPHAACANPTPPLLPSGEPSVCGVGLTVIDEKSGGEAGAGTLSVWCANAAESPELRRHVEAALAELAPAAGGPASNGSGGGEGGGGSGHLGASGGVDGDGDGTAFRFEAAASTWASP